MPLLNLRSVLGEPPSTIIIPFILNDMAVVKTKGNRINISTHFEHLGI